MAFSVTATDRLGRRSVYGSYDFAKEAIEKATELMSRGLVDVLIADRDGKYHTPSHFSRLFPAIRQFMPKGPLKGDASRLH